MPVTLCIPNSSSFPVIGQNTDRMFSFSNIRSIPYKYSCDNSKTSNDLDMKLGPKAKLEKKVLKKPDDDIISTNYDAFIIF